MENWTTRKIELDTDKKEVNKYLFKSFTIDARGNMLNETEYDSNNNALYKRVCRYFDTDKIKEFIEYDPFNELLERHLYTRNDNGEIDKVEFEFEEGRKTIKTFAFTDIGNADKATITDENGDVTGYEIYQLDELGRVVAEIELDADNNEISRYEKTYQEDEKLLYEKLFRDNKLCNGEHFEYDNNGNLIKKTQRDYINNNEVIDTYTYDSNNNMLLNCSHQNGTLVFENKCTYNEYNQLISEEVFQINIWTGHIICHEKLIHEKAK